MLHFLDEHFDQIGSFKTYGEVVDFIHSSLIYHLIYANTDDHPLVGGLDLVHTRWRFVYYKHSQLTAIYSYTGESPIKGIEREAFDQGLDLIEIHQGSSFNPIQLAVTTDLDIESLKKDWCETYCEAHGYSLMTYEGVGSIDEDSAALQTTGGADD